MDTRCPKCSKKLGRDLRGSIYVWCAFCRREVLLTGQVVSMTTIDKTTVVMAR